MATSAFPNSPSELSIEVVDWATEQASLGRVRQAVFIEEQGVPPELEWDGLDALCVHVLARARDGSPVGTARMQPNGHIGRMAVLRQWRDRGIGGALLRKLLATAAEAGLGQVHLNAQVQALGFYAAHGFTAEGEVFLDAGIPHRTMRLPLARTPGAMLEMGGEPDPTPVLGEPGPERVLSGSEQHRALTLALVSQARRSLHIVSRELDPRVYDQGPLVEAVKRLCLASRYSRARILVQDTGLMVQNGHRLLTLFRALPSRIEMRRLDREQEELQDAFLVVDEIGLVYRPDLASYRGVAEFHAPARARALLKRFGALWERSTPDSTLQRLHL